jgi:hypothetical protein
MSDVDTTILLGIDGEKMGVEEGVEETYTGVVPKDGISVCLVINEHW